MRLALYARVSKHTQDTDNQLIQLRNLAQQLRHPVLFEYIDTVCGASPDRPELARMLRDASRRRFDLLLFWSLDRISRGGILDTLRILERLQHAGVKFRSLSQPEIDTTSPWGNVIVAIFAAFAQIERDQLRERTRAGIARAREQGAQLGRPRRIVSIDRIREMKGQGKSHNQIARALGVSKSTVRRRLKSYTGR